MKWLISAETIAEYRSIPHIDFHDNSLFIGDSGNPTQQIMDDFCVHYTGGQLTLDSLIAELSRTMENKGDVSPCSPYPTRLFRTSTMLISVMRTS